MSRTRLWRVLLALVSGLALALAFPAYNVPILAWVSLAGLMVSVLGTSLRLAALLGFLHGAVFYTLTVPWVYTVMRRYGPLPVIAAVGVMALLVAAASLFHAAFGRGVAGLGRRGIGRACLAAPFLWVALEFALTNLPDIGFPWNLLGYAASHNLGILQLAAVTGIWGLSLLVAGYNALLVWIWKGTGRRFGRILAGAIVTVTFLAVAAFGGRYVPRARASEIAHLVQTNFPQAMSYPSDWMQSHAGELDQLERLSISAAQRWPGIVVWPEVPAPFYLLDPNFAARATRIAGESGSDFLVGVVNWRPSAQGNLAPYNSAALIDPTGRVDFVYDKIHLVPFGEYVPWRRWLWFAGKLTADVGDFQRGTEFKVGEFSGASGKGERAGVSSPGAGQPTFSVLICYEAVFPGEVRRFVAKGAHLLINLSNDGWFGHSAAAAQHLAMARVRAVENRRWLLRDTNTGITVSVDPYGRIIARLQPNVRGQLDAPYAFRSDLTVYTRWGDWAAWLSVAVFAILVLAVLAQVHMKRPDARPERKTAE